MINDSDFHSAICVYAWAFIFRLCYMWQSYSQERLAFQEAMYEKINKIFRESKQISDIFPSPMLLSGVNFLFKRSKNEKTRKMPPEKVYLLLEMTLVKRAGTPALPAVLVLQERL